jgi:ADP-ribose pyrophosphatase
MRILDSQLLYQGKLRGVRELVERDDGTVIRCETILHPGAVVILPILDDGRIVCVRQYRHAVRQRLLELPAGTLEVGEEPADCAQRELIEEIGMAAGEIVPLGELFPAPGFCSERQHLFCARKLSAQPGVGDADEDINVEIYPLSELIAAIRDGRLSDAKSIAMLMRAQVSGIL